MPRIKKRGLDYFPIDINFMQNRLIRRIMKREGEGALATLLSAFSCIYGGEGYYVQTDELFYEDLSASLYNQTAADVKRILALATEYGIFDAGLFGKQGILTSAEMQSQYLFSTKRRKSSVIDERYCLIDDTKEVEDTEEQEISPKRTTEREEEMGTETDLSATEDATFKDESAASNPENVTSGTHSTAENRIAENKIENPLLHSSPKGTQDADRMSAEGKEEDFSSSQGETKEEGTRHNEQAAPDNRRQATSGNRNQSRKEWTEEDINRLQPPQDGVTRNLDGLIYNLRQFRIDPQEQYAIVLKSNFGAIGHPLWKGFYALRESHGKIRQPGKYLLSLCTKK